MNNPVEHEDARTHPITVTMSRAPSPEVDAGTQIILRVKVSCPHGCDLRERVIGIVTSDGSVAGNSPLVEFANHVNETTEFAVVAPDEVGEHSWTVVFPKEADDPVHTEASVPMTVTTLAH